MPDPAGAVWADPDTPALCLIVLGVDRWGPEAIGWLPDTWAAEAAADTGAALHPRNADRVGAALTLLTRPDEFYRSPAGFTDVVQGLAAEWFEPDVWHPPTAAEAAWGLVEAHLIDPPGPDDAFAPAVARYVHMVCRHDGLPTLPGVFRAFGVPDDPGLPPPFDYSADPALAAAAAAGVQAAETDLSAFLADRLAALAARLHALPLRRLDARPVAAEVMTFARRLAAAARDDTGTSATDFT